ncbi:MAG: carbohydrate ABC transporter permease [Bacilli bacterium]|nr:carbohydrate ABC transporter permease [Bacilli bacterium]
MRVEYVRNSSNAKKKVQTTKRELLIERIGSYIVLAILASIVVIPFYILLVSSFKTKGFIGFNNDPNPFSNMNFEGFKTALFGSIATFDDGSSKILLGLRNTFIIVLPSTVIGLFTSALSAYAAAKIRFKGRNVIFYIMLITTMIPGIVMMTPLVTIFTNLDLYNTYFPLMVPGMFGTAMCVFFLRQTFMAIPDDYIDAARLDGISHFKIFWKIVVPLSAPSLISQGILGFVAGYNDYLGPLLYLRGDDQWTVTLQTVLNEFLGQSSSNLYQALMAATVLSLIPTVVIFILCQKFFVKGIVNSGIK